VQEISADGRARVRVGNVTVAVKAAELTRAAAAPTPAPAPPTGAPAGGYTGPEAEAVSGRIDVRGLERAAAIESVDRFLDRLLLQGAPLAEIVHGKGTGALRAAIQAYLAAHPQVAEFRLGEHAEGGSGVTIVKLR
jgi:DNA mismatch repair protein MutS2